MRLTKQQLTDIRERYLEERERIRCMDADAITTKILGLKDHITALEAEEKVSERFRYLSIKELQQVGLDEIAALTELGRRVIDFEFCDEDTKKYCASCEELEQLQRSLEEEMPPYCPHCGKLVDAEPGDYVEDNYSANRSRNDG